MTDPDQHQVRVLWQRRRLASRDYECFVCCNTIQKGTRYMSVGVIQDGEFQYIKEHLRDPSTFECMAGGNV